MLGVDAARESAPLLFFFNDTATTEIYTLSLHDALPISDQLAHGAEEVELQAEQPVEPLQDRERRARAVPVVADQAAHGQPVALLDPGLVVLAVGPAPGEAQPPAAAPREDELVEELAAIVTMPLAQREGEPGAEVLQPIADMVIVQPPQGLQFGPAGGHVDGDEGGEVKARGGLAAMQDEIPLDRPRGDAGPLAPRAHRHLSPQARHPRGGPAGLAAAPPPQRPQEPVEGRGAGRE